MRVVVPLSIACVVLLVAFVTSQQGGCPLVRGESSSAEQQYASAVVGGNEESPRAADEQDRSLGATPAAAPSDAEPSAYDTPPSAVKWSHDLESAMKRAQASGRMLLLYVAAPAET